MTNEYSVLDFGGLSKYYCTYFRRGISVTPYARLVVGGRPIHGFLSFYSFTVRLKKKERERCVKGSDNVITVQK